MSRCLIALKTIKGDFDLIAVRGASGLVVGPIVAYTMQKSLLVVRKPNEGVHEGVKCIDPGIERIGARTVMLDDFVCSGETLGAIQAMFTEPIRFVCLYGENGFYGPASPAPMTKLRDHLWGLK